MLTYAGRDGKLDTRSLYDRVRIILNDYARALKKILFAKNAIVLFVSFGGNKEFLFKYCIDSSHIA
jgi:hypothetical protein